MLPEEKYHWLKKKRKVKYARKLRKRMTPEEVILWNAVRGKKLNGLKFRRQAPIGSFIVDFLCISAQLIVEIDGGIHKDRKEYDEGREEYLKELGYRIIRFPNNKINHSLPDVLKEISKVANTIHVQSFTD
ncbi:DUF559 domain-containing protein [Patescibacteria group bacterium]|nr:DUF559 domain-containing protein [Patescibacteria group bacterium]MBU1123935.1 DUF559 domain-containing protein [Patescibacteria group bacterium]MBU1911643.1 DUF559 domain-containing protein [Patescibacteria group bacterium]